MTNLEDYRWWHDNVDVKTMDEVFGEGSMDSVQQLQELRLNEPDIFARKRYLERSVKRFIEGKPGLVWLHRALGLPYNFDLESIILDVDLDGPVAFYHPPRIIPKPKGGSRIIISPRPELLFIQRRINRLLQRTFPPPENVFGYRGGTCLQVAERHVNWTSTLKFDVKDAFFQVSWGHVRGAIVEPCIRSRPGFSSRVSYWIAKLCTYSPPPPMVQERFSGFRSFLPQGAPTSPICFDLACADLDKKLGQIAQRVGGIVSRYADNYYFSMPTSRISSKLERIIMCEAGERFPIHKVRKVGQGELCRMLGYNLVNGKINNTRGFHRLLRGSLHVVKTRLDRGLDYRDDWLRVRGLMGFAVNLPARLQKAYEDCNCKM